MCCFSFMPLTIGRILVRNPSMICRPVNFGMRGPSNVTSSAKGTLDRSFVAKQSRYASTAAIFCSRDMRSPRPYIHKRTALCLERALPARLEFASLTRSCPSAFICVNLRQRALAEFWLLIAECFAQLHHLKRTLRPVVPPAHNQIAPIYIVCMHKKVTTLVFQFDRHALPPIAFNAAHRLAI